MCSFPDGCIPERILKVDSCELSFVGGPIPWSDRRVAQNVISRYLPVGLAPPCQMLRSEQSANMIIRLAEINSFGGVSQEYAGQVDEWDVSSMA
jgi:hypothetical protein